MDQTLDNKYVGLVIPISHSTQLADKTPISQSQTTPAFYVNGSSENGANGWIKLTTLESLKTYSAVRLISLS